MRSAAVTGTVLVVDDDDGFARVVTEMGRQTRCRILRASSLDEARGLLEQHEFDLILVDIELPDGNGLDLLDSLDLAEQGRVVIVTGMPSVASAVRVLKSPVVDYLIKPVTAAAWQEMLGEAHARAVERARMAHPIGGMIGASPEMQALFESLRRVGPVDVSVLIHGESGTGKELVARALHEESGRRGPFVAFNSGAVTHDLMGSHLFGHERGAFTGAVQAHAGYFEQADGGTLFLDEITEMPLPLQVYLLRVIESHRLTRVGGTREIPVDVRLIAATNRGPKACVDQGTLRADLYYRLSEYSLRIPPLRERREDIPLLARWFLEGLNRKYRTAKTFAPGAESRMAEGNWPGNVRELRHAVQRSYLHSGDDAQVRFEPEAALESPTTGGTAGVVQFAVGMSFEDIEREMLLKTLARCGNNKARAARILGITSKTIYNRLLRYRSQGLIDDAALQDPASDHPAA
ncbi:MAG: sigma-54-dependent transcriptional regulator [Rhodanobacteraceae bacterium]